MTRLFLLLTMMAAPATAQDTTAVARDQERLAAEIQRAEDVLRAQGIPVVLQRVSFSLSSDGGVEPRIGVKNLSSKSIKRVSVTLVGFDAEGNLAKGTVRGSSRHTLRLDLVKPLTPGDDADFRLRTPPWYSPVTTCLELQHVTVDFTDGSWWVDENDLTAARMDNPVKLQGECAGG